MRSHRVLAAGLVVVLVAVTIVPNAGAQSLETFLEGFEGDTEFDFPSANWYDFTTAGGVSFVSSAQAAGGDQSFFFDPTDSSRSANFDLDGTLCDSTADPADRGGWRASIYVVNGTDNWDVGISNSGGTNNPFHTSPPNMYRSLSLATSGGDRIVRLAAGNNGGTTFETVPGATWNPGEWLTFIVDCATERLIIPAQDIAYVSNKVVAPSPSLSHLFIARRSGSAEQGAYLDDVSVTMLQAASVLTADAEVTVNNLVGFDVDTSGATIITRQDGGSTIKAYSTGTLSELGSPGLDVNCNRVHGVAALRDHVSYLFCDAGDATDVSQLQIRSRNLGSPDFGEICPQGDFCYADLDDEDLAGPQDDQIDIHSVTHVPFDFTDGTTSGLNRVDAAWGYTTITGEVGVMTYTWNNNDFDQSRSDSSVLSSQTPDAICVTTDDDDLTYIYGSSSESTARGWRVSFERVGFPSAGRLDVSMSQVFGGNTATSGAVSVGCGEGRFAVATPTTITVWDCRTCTSSPASITLTGLPNVKGGGLTMSDNGEWIAWVDNDGAYVACANVGGCLNTATNTTAAGGEVVAQLEVPDGTFRSIKMHGAGSSVWIATSDVIAQYDIFSFTSGQDVTYDPDAATIDDGGGDGGIGSAGDLLPPPSQREIDTFGSAAAVQAFRGLIMLGAGAAIAGGGIVTAAVQTKARISLPVIATVAAAGGVIATVTGFIFGIVADWFLGVVIFVFVSVVVLLLYSKFGGKGEE